MYTFYIYIYIYILVIVTIISMVVPKKRQATEPSSSTFSELRIIIVAVIIRII